MRILCVSVFLFTVGVATAQVTKCTDSAGHVTYQEGPCVAGAKSDATKVATPKWREGMKVPVSDEVVQACFRSYKVLSRNPSAMKLLGYTASVPPAGFPVVNVSAIVPNKFGGVDRTLLWCKLKDDLTLDREAISSRLTDFHAASTN